MNSCWRTAAKRPVRLLMLLGPAMAQGPGSMHGPLPYVAHVPNLTPWDYSWPIATAPVPGLQGSRVRRNKPMHGASRRMGTTHTRRIFDGFGRIRADLDKLWRASADFGGFRWSSAEFG